MTNNTHYSLSSGAQRLSLFRYSARLLTLLLILVAATTQAKADDFYTYTYDGQYNLYKVTLSAGFKAELNKASGGEFTGTTAAGSTVTWKTGDALPAFDGNYNGGTDTSFPLSLNSLFGNCSNVISLDLSNYNTANVTNMSYLFYNCGNLKSVNLSNLNTEKVTTLESMFEECSSLESLDLSDFNTANVTNMLSMFANCTVLSTIDLSSFNTANVTDMSSMFADCKALTALDLSSFSLKDGVTLTNMFSGTCDNTQTLIYGLAATDAIATALNGSTTGINTAKLKFSASKVSSFKDDFYTYTYDSKAQVYTVALSDAFKTELNKASDGSFTGFTAALTSLTWETGDPLPAFDANYNDGTNGTHPLLLEYLFSECSAITSLDLSKYNTANVTSMSSMFDGCSSLQSVNLSSFNTEKVTTMSAMFYDCTSLGSLDLSHFNTAHVTTMQMMFYGCSALTSLKLSSNFTTANVRDMESMFNGCSQLSSLDVSNFSTTNVNDMGSMFKGCSHLSSLDVSKFNTAIVTNMSSMFKGCSRLSSLDVSKLNTEKVRDMASMFEGCSSLSSLNLSSFNTASVTNMKFMFSGCTSLSTLDLSKFNTASVTNMTSMFADCKALTALDLSSFSLKDGVNLTSMFSGTCDNTQSLIYGLAATDAIATLLNNSSTTGINSDKLKFRVLKDEFYTYTYDSNAQVYKVALTDAFKAELNKASDGSFTGLTAALTSLTWKTGDPLPAFNSNYNDGTNGTHPLSLEGLFNGCFLIASLDLSNYNTANVTDMSSMFYQCGNLSSLNLSKFNTEKVTTMENMFNGCQSLSSIDLSNFNTANVNNMRSMFANCYNLTSLDLSNFNTANVASMYGIFRNCNALSSINLKGFNTAKVTDMQNMFDGCNVLASLDLTSFTLNGTVNLKNMFRNTCSNNQALVYGFAATEDIAAKLNSGTTTINTDKLTFVVTLLAIDGTNFPDAVFRKFVSDNYDTNGDGYLAGDELSVTTMDVSGKGIVSLKGVEYFTSLTSLNCSNNALTALDLSKNTKLTTFNGTGQSVTSTLSYDTDSKKGYFDIAGGEAGKLSVTGFTVADNNGMPRATSNEAVTDRKLFDQVAYTSDTGMGGNQLSGQFSLRTFVLPFNARYATLCLPWNATVPEGMKTYTVKVSGNNALLNPYEGSVLPKGTAFVVDSTATLLLRYTDSEATAPANNDLKGTTSDMTVTAHSVMTLGHSDTDHRLGFYSYTGTMIDAYKGYLNKANGAKRYLISLGTTTGISLPDSVETDNEPWYSLQGARLPVKPTQPGIYIHGKRKVLIK